MFETPETKSYEEVDAAQAKLHDAGLDHWSVTPMHGISGDSRAYFKATRVAPGGIREVTHREAHILVELAREVDARLASIEPQATAVVSGTADTTTGG
jgi:hypothetical protein